MSDIIIEEPTIEYVDVEENTVIENNKPITKGTTTPHFVKFMNELLDIMDMDGGLIATDNSTIHKSHSMIREIESRAIEQCAFLLTHQSQARLRSFELLWREK